MLKECSKTPDSNESIHKYYCKACDYGCNRRFLMKQHEATQKHISAYSGSEECHVCSCGKTYKHIQSLRRHIKVCKGNKQLTQEQKPVITNEESAVVLPTEAAELRSMMTSLLEQNCSMMGEAQALRDIVRELIPRVGNNNTTVNAQFNINMFLNEKCKDAINLTDFVETLNLDASDLDITRQNGYAAGIANIFLKGLQQLDLHKRPIHCSDLKREVLYVKDAGIWGMEDDEKPKIRSAINAISKKQVNAIKQWESENPGWQDSEKGTAQYCEMVRHITGSDGAVTDCQIIKTIAREVIIDK